MELMKPYYVEIKDSETASSIVVDMEGPYHPKNERVGEHIYGVTILIDGVPYHFEKYVPTKEELQEFQEENEGKPPTHQFASGRRCGVSQESANGAQQYSQDVYLYRLIPFTE